MSDRYLEFTHSSIGKTFAKLLGLPQPPRLRRAVAAWAAQPLEGRSVLFGAAAGSALALPVLNVLHTCGATVRIVADHVGFAPIKTAAAAMGVQLQGNPSEAGEARNHAVVFDATGVASPAQLRELFDFLQPTLRGLDRNARVLLLSRAPQARDSAVASAASAALRGFVRSLGKELGRNGTTVNLLELENGADESLDAPLRYFLTEHSAYVCGQVLTIRAGGRAATTLRGSLSNKVALVTGAARGIGASIAEVLAREGAQVIGMDHPSAEGALGETMGRVGGVGLALDVTAPDAPQRIAAEVGQNFGGLDVVVHNAGITRDKMLRNMPPHFWDAVLAVNFGAIVNITDGLLREGLNDGGRIVCISSMNGIAGAAGQTNYASTKSGLITYVEAMAATLAARGGAINAVAPGFIETQMTASMPVGPREVGRRISSLSQGGLPVDIAEAVAFFASPAAIGVNGSTLRVCGQNWFGA